MNSKRPKNLATAAIVRALKRTSEGDINPPRLALLVREIGVVGFMTPVYPSPLKMPW